MFISHSGSDLCAAVPFLVELVVEIIIVVLVRFRLDVVSVGFITLDSQGMRSLGTCPFCMLLIRSLGSPLSITHEMRSQ